MRLLLFFVLHVFLFTSSLSKKPHIIVIIADDMGRNDVGFHGTNQIPTPNIDALAYNGIILDKFYTQSTCTPSRTAFLTGNYPIRSGMQGYPLRGGENRSIPMDMATMPERLKGLGYKTHLVGKWHVGAATRNNTPTGRGFDTHFGYWNGFVGYFDYVSPSTFPNGHVAKGLDIHDQFEPVWSAQGKYATDLFTERALEIIESHDVEKPLFLMVSHLAPHTGTDGVELGVPNATLTDLKYWYIKDPRRRLYADVVNLIDVSTGQIVKKLSEKNMLDNSIVLFFSDNGGQTVGMYANSASNWPLRGVKFSDFEGGIRCAGTIFSPLLKTRSYVSKALIHLTDWLPTFYSAAGGNLTDLGQIDGIDQWRTLSERLSSNRTEILININDLENTSTIITDHGRYKLLHGSFARGLYDKYYSDSGRGPDVPPYNPETILNSTTNQLIHTITKTQIYQLRSQADVAWCRSETKTPDINCTTGCLFDLFNDPCETTNIIHVQPEITQRLRRRLSDFESVFIPVKSKEADLTSDPVFYNNTWCTWLDDSWCFKTTNIDRL